MVLKSHLCLHRVQSSLRKKKKQNWSKYSGSSLKAEKSVEVLCKQRTLGMMDTVNSREGETWKELVDGGILYK